MFVVRVPAGSDLERTVLHVEVSGQTLLNWSSSCGR